MNIADKLRKVLEIKNNIKAALEEKGIENVGNDFSNYAESIANIKGGGDEPEPEIPEIPEIEIPDVELPGLPDLRAILDENVIEGYPYRIAQLVVDSEPTSTLSNDYNNPSPCKIRTSDGRTYTSHSGGGWNSTSHTWTYGTTGYRWVIHYYDTQTISFTNIQNNCLQIILDGVRMYDYGTLLPPPGGITTPASKKALTDHKEYIRSIESINGGKWLSVNYNKNASYKETFYGCSSLEYLSDDIFDLDHMGSCSPSEGYKSMFQGCYFLKSIPNLNTSNATSLSNLFRECYSLVTIPLIDTSNGTNFSYMFSDCHSLTTIPELNTSKGTGFDNMFQSCYSLKYIPELNTSKGTNFSSMFQSCYSLKSIPLIDTSKGTGFSSMFQSCYLLVAIPLIDTSNGTNFSSMFQNCYSLVTIPLIDTSNGTNFSSMFSYCDSLVAIPLIDTSNGTNFSSMFSYCDSLVTIPLIDTSNGTNFSNMFTYCNSLVTIPLIDTSNGTNFEKMFNYCRSLKFIPELNTSKGTSFNNYIEYLWGSPIKEVKVNVSNSTRAITLFSSYCNNIKSVIITIGNNFNYSLSLRNLYGSYLKIIGNIQNSLSFVQTYLSVFEIDGTINYNLDFSNAKGLTKQSLLNIINALVPQEEGVTKTLNLGSTNIAKLSEEEIAIATSKGWTIS